MCVFLSALDGTWTPVSGAVSGARMQSSRCTFLSPLNEAKRQRVEEAYER